MDDKARDRYLTRKYGITLAEYLAMLEAQKGVCAICKKPPVNNALAVDHDHKWKYLRIFVGTGLKDKFYAFVGSPETQEIPCARAYATLEAWAPKINAAKRKLRALMKRASVRGLLCTNCNPALRQLSDDPVRIRNAAEYLEKHQQNKEN